MEYGLELECWDQNFTKEDDLIGRCSVDNLHDLVHRSGPLTLPLKITPEELDQQQVLESFGIEFEDHSNSDFTDRVLRYIVRTGLTLMLACRIWMISMVAIGSSTNFWSCLQREDNDIFRCVLIVT